MSFLRELSFQDLCRLRAVVRRTHAMYSLDPLSTIEQDKLIEAIGEEVAQAMLKVAVDRRLVG